VIDYDEFEYDEELSHYVREILARENPTHGRYSNLSDAAYDASTLGRAHHDRKTGPRFALAVDQLPHGGVTRSPRAVGPRARKAVRTLLPVLRPSKASVPM
jgi:hypothetical protein